MRITLDGEQFELTPEAVRARLAGHNPEPIRSYWVEIDGVRWPVKQVISCATGVHDRQRFQSQSARRWLGNLGFALSGGQSVLRSATTPVAPVVRPDVVLVGCVKSKRDVGAPAKDLYTSDYFVKMRRYAEASGTPWFILSAEHGLVDPDEWLDPYDMYLADTSREYRRSWGQKVVDQLDQAIGSLDGVVVDAHAGAAYVDAIDGLLRERGAQVIDQLRGLSFGRRLSWYLERERHPVADLERTLAQLRDGAAAVDLNSIVDSGGDGLRMPGMYSWWVDAAGADDLSRGLGHRIEPGLLYAGLAGATRSGGSTSSNTLWGRIATMHLGKRHEFSTLRLSLGSVLANGNGQTAIDEAQLTRWMYAHLRIIAIPVADVDSLGDLETEILADLHPPLNLAKVSTTAIRRRLSQLRKEFGGRRPPTSS